MGQVMLKYASLLECPCVQYGQEAPKNQVVFTFILPVEFMMKYIESLEPTKVYAMTVCETATVHPLYGTMFKRYPSWNWFTPSEFCKNIFENQFPNVQCSILRHWIARPPPCPVRTHEQYTFYVIGNVADQRKNMQKILETFFRMRSTYPNIRLLIKATTKNPWNIQLPGVEVVQGLLKPDEMEHIHGRSDCYISLSHSEGVGMGAIEAAMHNKPVIIQDFGGCKEYIQTPFICSIESMEPIGSTDFLYTPDLQWAHHASSDLLRHMTYCVKNNVRS